MNDQANKKMYLGNFSSNLEPERVPRAQVKNFRDFDEIAEICAVRVDSSCCKKMNSQ